MMRWRLLILVLVVLFTSIEITVALPSPASYVFNESTNIIYVDLFGVSLNISNAYIHSTSGSYEVNLSNNGMGLYDRMNVLVISDPNKGIPEDFLLYNPRIVQNIINYTKCSEAGTFCNFTLSPKHFWHWRNTTWSTTDNQTNITTYNEWHTLIFEHDFEFGSITEKWVTWYENETMLYQSVSPRSSGVKWGYNYYLFDNLNFSIGKSYSVKMPMKFEFNTKGKVYLFIWPSSLTIEEAIALDHYIFVDPWWDNTYLTRTPLKFNINTSENYENATIVNATAVCEDGVCTNISLMVNASGIFRSNGAHDIWNTSSGLNSSYYWYNNSASAPACIYDNGSVALLVDCTNSTPFSPGLVASNKSRVYLVYKGFEDGTDNVVPSGWTVQENAGTVRVSAEWAAVGSKSLKLTDSGAQTAVLGGFIDFPPQNRVIVEAILYVNASGAYGGLGVNNILTYRGDGVETADAMVYVYGTITTACSSANMRYINSAGSGTVINQPYCSFYAIYPLSMSLNTTNRVYTDIFFNTTSVISNTAHYRTPINYNQTGLVSVPGGASGIIYMDELSVRRSFSQMPIVILGASEPLDSSAPTLNVTYTSFTNNSWVNASNNSVQIDFRLDDDTSNVGSPTLCEWNNGTAINYTATVVSGSGTPNVSARCKFNNNADGTHYLRLYWNDSAGNGNQSGLYTVLIDATPPFVTSNISNSTYASSAFDVTLRASDITSPLSALWYKLDSNANVTYVVNTTVPLSGLFNGPHTFQYGANDTAGNRNTTVVYFTVDTTPPVIKTNLSNTTYTFSTAPPISMDVWLNVSDATSSVNFSWFNVNSTANSTPASNNRTVTLTGLSEGANNVTFYANDSVGNLNVTVVYFTINTYPTITINSPSNTTTSDDTPLLNATFNRIVNYTWYNVDSGTNSTSIGNTSNLTVNLTTLSDGPHNVVVYANTSSGLLNSTTRYFTVDANAPYRVNITSPVASYNTTSTSIQFNFTALDAVSINMTANLTIDDVVNVSNIKLTNNTINSTNVSGFAEGRHNFSVKAWDSQNQSNTSTTYNFTVDLTSPNSSSGGVTPGTVLERGSITISINASDALTGIQNVTAQVRGPDGIGRNYSLSNTNGDRYAVTISGTSTDLVGGYSLMNFYVTDYADGTNNTSPGLTFTVMSTTGTGGGGGGGGGGTTSYEQCSNGVDDDGDGLIDAMDSDCVTSTPFSTPAIIDQYFLYHGQEFTYIIRANKPILSSTSSNPEIRVEPVADSPSEARIRYKPTGAFITKTVEGEVVFYSQGTMATGNEVSYTRIIIRTINTMLTFGVPEIIGNKTEPVAAYPEEWTIEEKTGTCYYFTGPCKTELVSSKPIWKVDAALNITIAFKDKNINITWTPSPYALMTENNVSLIVYTNIGTALEPKEISLILKAMNTNPRLPMAMMPQLESLPSSIYDQGFLSVWTVLIPLAGIAYKIWRIRTS